jgi:hypothetical protein
MLQNERKARWYSPCQVPRLRRPSVIGMTTDDPTSDAFVWETLETNSDANLKEHRLTNRLE